MPAVLPMRRLLKQTTTGSDIYRHTGTPVHPMSPLCKIMWIRENQPAIFTATHKFISIKEFIFYRFFDQYLVDHSIASATGLFDIYKKAWYAPALEAAGITSRTFIKTDTHHANNPRVRQYMRNNWALTPIRLLS